MIYLDNAASSFPKPVSVAKAVSESIRKNGANPGRSGHYLSEKAALDIFNVREAFGDYYSCDAENIVFTKNATEALNFAIKGLLCMGDHVVISDLEHNSVLRPVVAMQKDFNCNYSITETSLDDEETFQNFKKCITPNTKMVVFTHASNVTGQLLPIERIGKYCRENGIIFIVDTCQTSGLLVPQNADIICTAGHKGLYGPQGTGLLIVKNLDLTENMVPSLHGGTGTDSLSLYQPGMLPEGFEAGTLNTPGILGLHEGLKFVKMKGDTFKKKERALHKLLINSLKAIPNIILYSDYQNHVPTVSFNIKGMSSEHVTEKLNDRKICVRGGYHCSALCHAKLHTENRGAVRASLGAFNNQNDVEQFIHEVNKIAKL